MKTSDDKITPALRQLLVEAAAELEDLTDDGGYEVDAVRRLAGRLRDAAAGKPLERTYDVRVTATLTMKVPGDLDPATAEGVERLKAIIVEGLADEVAKHIEWGAFDIEASEVEDE